MIIGFTGTRKGMTDTQRNSVVALLAVLECKQGHHGDCIGADAEFHDLLGRRNAVRIVHPPIDGTHRANVAHYEFIHPPKTHFARNRDIVIATSVLIGAPCELIEQPRGGTWYTIRYAIKQGSPVYIVWPDGTTSTPATTTGRRTAMLLHTEAQHDFVENNTAPA
jgi:hypothetical protein